MTDQDQDLLQKLLAEGEREWIEFKCNNSNPAKIGEYISALSNAAALHRQPAGFLIWGVNDDREQVGTQFRPRKSKKGNEELESWLTRGLTPNLDIRFREFECDGKSMVILEVPAASHAPVAFQNVRFVRVGSYKKPLKDQPEKERSLWRLLSGEVFEKRIAKANVPAEQLLTLLSYGSFFKLKRLDIPAGVESVVRHLEESNLVQKSGGSYDITMLGAALFANSLADFDMARKTARVIQYAGVNRTETVKEQEGTRGIAAGFEWLVSYINSLLPQNEVVGEAVRDTVRMYPEIAIRELVANALIHQDFEIGGSGPMIEVFSDRVEITNPGVPLIEINRLLDLPPKSRNDVLARMMRHLGICEERGSGIDKVLAAVEAMQLPAPTFAIVGDNTRVTLFAHKQLKDMSKEDRIRACYQHAGLQYVSNQKMTNASLRKRFNIEDRNYSVASRIINETLEERLIKSADPTSKSKKYASYLPFWA